MINKIKYVNNIVRIIIIVACIAVFLAFFLPYGSVSFMGQAIPISGWRLFRIVASGTLKDFASLTDDMSFIFMTIIINFSFPVIGALLSLIRMVTLKSKTDKFKRVRDNLIINSLFPIFLWASSLILLSAKLGDFGILGGVVENFTNVGLWLTTAGLLTIFVCSFLLFKSKVKPDTETLNG
ncbi:hypothetical protein JXI42_03075 [bacterium]|nr:hypothetical protein [bacterium]